MGRALLDALGLFLLPFAAYAVLVVLQRRWGSFGAAWTGGRLAWLTAAGLVSVLIGLLVLGSLVPRHQGAYTPAHVEGGRLVPGDIR